MTHWTRTIQIRDLLTGEEDSEAIKRVADGLISRLPDAPMDRISKARSMADEDPEVALLVLNRGLDAIYDWADFNRVWLS